MSSKAAPSKANVDVNVHHVTRVEGHGNIVVDVKKGTIKECQWQVVEAPRFFEAMVVGRRWSEMAHITSRICGICSIGHTMASLKATEAALGITPSEQTLKLRKVLTHGENLQSHILHAGYLVVPDLFGVGSVIPLATTHKDAVLAVVRLHRLANEMCNLFGGRTTHPITAVVNGFTSVPKPSDMKAVRDRLEASIDDLKSVAGVVLSVADKIPDFSRETEYIALTTPEEYALYDGDIGSTDGGTWPVSEYLSITNEYCVPQSTAKYTKHNRSSYAAGALARFNLNHEQLQGPSKEVAEMLGLKAPCCNPFMNTVAQIVECVDSTLEAIRLIDELIESGVEEEDAHMKVQPGAGQGVGAVDVPRGILFHDYTFDENGVCTAANCIIPTNQNHASIQDDFDAFLPMILDKSEKEIELALEMLVRAYDPCISCSVHYLNVEFV
ncbi:MAG: Ni/Fe hydrogenase subunit alpha [Planctomycetes bacterium]|nr:Ni/Fe hydrogenase subunit alpha [Planctomycetota bacterium]